MSFQDIGDNGISLCEIHLVEFRQSVLKTHFSHENSKEKDSIFVLKRPWLLLNLSLFSRP